mgnify:CR=1 FL=1
MTTRRRITRTMTISLGRCVKNCSWQEASGGLNRAFLACGARAMDSVSFAACEKALDGKVAQAWCE